MLTRRPSSFIICLSVYLSRQDCSSEERKVSYRFIPCSLAGCLCLYTAFTPERNVCSCRHPRKQTIPMSGNRVRYPGNSQQIYLCLCMRTNGTHEGPNWSGERGGGVRRNKTSGVAIWFSSFPRPPAPRPWGSQAKNRSRFLTGKLQRRPLKVLPWGAWGWGGGSCISPTDLQVLSVAFNESFVLSYLFQVPKRKLINR